MQLYYLYWCKNDIPAFSAHWDTLG